MSCVKVTTPLVFVTFRATGSGAQFDAVLGRANNPMVLPANGTAGALPVAFRVSVPRSVASWPPMAVAGVADSVRLVP